jgi:hypothetical protein
VDGTGRRDGRQGADETQEQRIEREREEASEAERDAAAEPGYTARPTDAEPGENGPEGDEPAR